MENNFKDNNMRYLKITLIIVGILVGIIILDTLQARIFKNSPIISWKDELEDSDSWVDRGILMDTYYCTREQDIQNVSWKFKGSKFTCPIDNEETTSSPKIEVIKPEYHNDIKFNKYLERDGRTIYLAGNLEEVFYYTDSNTKITLKDHITKAYQTTDDSIKELTDLMTHTGTLKDGGTKIYKSKNYDITIIKCNTIAGNNNIFIGDYSMEFDNESMCK